jgi:hypothetical protein
MAYNSTTNVPVTVQLASSIPGALIRRFVRYETTTPGTREVITLVPGANGAYAAGILAESIDTTQSDGFYASSIVLPGGYTEIICGETWTTGAPLRSGGAGAEADGTAWLANATGDVIIAYALSDCTAGNIGTINFVGYAGVTP